MELVPLSRGSPFLPDVSRINEESFPANERVSVDEMLEVGSEDGNGF
ncbi:MAG: hypothetical protein IKQ60_05740 [Candidatus Methanomethylophilaceae archaeon]|nr:hypothetical protein [Candidatus Methanomethylophilaceae archaeon]